MEEEKEEIRTDVSFIIEGLKAIWDLLDDQRRAIARAVLWLFISSVLFLGVPLCLKFVFDELPQVARSGVTERLVVLLVVMTVVPLMGEVVVRRRREPIFLTALINVENDLPVRAQKKLLELSQRYHDSGNSAENTAKITRGTQSLVQCCMTLFWNILPQAFSLILSACTLGWLNWRLALVCYLPFLPMLILLKRMFDKNAEFWVAWHADHEKSIGLIVQSIVNVSTVQGYVQERRELATNHNLRDSLRQRDIAVCLAHQNTWLVANVVLHSSFIAAVLLGVWQVVRLNHPMGSLVYLIGTGIASVNAVGNIIVQYTELIRGLSSVVRVRALMDEVVDVADEAPGVVPTTGVGRFVFNDVTFRYHGRPNTVLEHFNLVIEPGQLVALVALSGGGKSTIAKLLARVYDPQEGTVELDGVNIRTVDRDWYRRQFAVVQQEMALFNGTLRENIVYGCPDATDAEVSVAVGVAHLTDFLRTLPEGLETRVGERGMQLSGGQRQRVSIARAYLAVLRGTRALILDEATSNLDGLAERGVQERLVEQLRAIGTTIIVIAHRMSTIRRADMIYVIERGQVVESGDHARLMVGNGLYARLVELQRLGEIVD